MKSRKFGLKEIGIWEFIHRDKYGKIIDRWESENTLANEGQYAWLDVFLRDGTAPSAFYLALVNDTPLKTDAMSDLQNEPPDTYGYARQEITRDETGWPTLGLNSGDEMATSLTVTFTASGGDIGPVTYAVLTTTLSGTGGKHLAFAALSQTRTLHTGESLSCQLKIKQQ
jgi:hypothetical protein